MTRIATHLCLFLLIFMCESATTDAREPTANRAHGLALSASISKNGETILNIQLRNKTTAGLTVVTGIEGPEDYRAANFNFSLETTTSPLNWVICTECYPAGVAGLPRPFRVALAPQEEFYIPVALHKLRMSAYRNLSVCDFAPTGGKLTIALERPPINNGHKDWSGVVMTSIPLVC